MPAGVTANKVQFRQATFIETSIANVERVLVEAAVVVAVILLLFLMNVRATLISLTAIPVSILTTALVFSFFGLSINTMTLGGLAIAIGALVDDAVVGVENILRRLKENRELAPPLPALQVVARASQEVRSGIFYATVIIILVFVPLFALSGVEGRLFVPLGIAFIVSILASLVTSITLTPVLAFYFLAGQQGHGERDSWVVRHLKRGNTKLLHWALANSKVLFATFAIGVMAATVGAFLLPRAFLPPFNEGTILVSLQYNPGISLAESNRLGAIAERLIMDIPEVKSLGRRTGRAELDEHAEGVHTSEIDVDLVRSEPKQGGGVRAYSHASSPSCRSPPPWASRSRIASTTCSRASRHRSCSRSSARISIPCVRLPRCCGPACNRCRAWSTCRSRSRCSFRS